MRSCSVTGYQRCIKYSGLKYKYKYPSLKYEYKYKVPCVHGKYIIKFALCRCKKILTF